MSRKRKQPRRRGPGGRVTPPARDGFRPMHEPEVVVPVEDDHPLADVQEALGEDHPLGLLAVASPMAWVIAPTRRSPFDDADDEDDLDPSVLLETLEQIDEPVSTALLHAFGVLLSDEVSRRRCQRAVRDRTSSVPDWVELLDRAEVTRTVRMSDLVGDGSNVYLELRWPNGHHLVVLVYVDNHLGGAAKDGFAVDGTFEELRDLFVELMDDPDEVVFEDVDPAFARAWLEEALDIADHTWPPLESETWPAAQPLVRWVLRMLPAGGEAPDVVEWADADVDAIRDRFLASALARPLRDEFGEDVDDLVEHVLWYGTGYGTQDPFRWSPLRVELFLLDFLPRKVVAPYEALAPAPDVLGAFVIWAHRESGLDEHLTVEALDAIAEHADDFDDLVGDTDRPTGPFALLDAMGLDAMGLDAMGLDAMGLDAMGLDAMGLGADGPIEEWGDIDWVQWTVQRSHGIAVAAVGSEEALAALDDQPLPGDEPLDTAAFPDDIAPRVQRTAELTDRVASGYFDDPELATAFRRFLADVAAGDPAIFRRRSKDETAAAAVCWVVAKANDRLPHGTTGEMLATLGVSGSVTQRAQPMVEAVGAERFDSWAPYLGTPRYLTGARRAELLSPTLWS